MKEKKEGVEGFWRWSLGFGVVGVLHLVFGDERHMLLPVETPQIWSHLWEHPLKRHWQLEDFGGVAAQDEVDLIWRHPIPNLMDLMEHPLPKIGLIRNMQ